MRGILAFLLLWVFPAFAQVGLPWPGPGTVHSTATGIAVVCHGHAAGQSSPTTVAADCTGANLIVINTASYAGGLPAPTDSSSNSYTASTCSSVGTGPGQGCVYWKYAPTVTNSMTFSVAQASVFASIEFIGFSGTAGSSIDQDSNTTLVTSSTTCQPASITPSTTNQVVVASLAANELTGGVNSINSGFTISDQDAGVAGTNYGGALAYIIETSIVAKQPTWTNTATAGQLTCMTASFQ